MKKEKKKRETDLLRQNAQKNKQGAEENDEAAYSDPYISSSPTDSDEEMFEHARALS